MFKDRIDAGKQLAQRILNYKNKDVVVVAIPRGGLPLGAIVAKALNAPLDVVLTKKIGHPINKEYAIGAVSLGNKFITDSGEVSMSYIEDEIRSIRALLRQRQDQYYKNSKPKVLKNKIVIIVDDGIATGNTMLATIRLIKDEEPSRIIVAVPVASLSALEKLNNSPFVDETVCLLIPRHFRAVGQFYTTFNSVDDKIAIQILEESNKQFK
ncbi:phosphoribosyltransferase [Kordia sp. YSTF-M3]|uniref:Phosphoribosyltransferase n=1 Tax=Kordia aestuariivivens TaxID=2759037 RepID=A0ABR7QGD4_9FLAO|nr:phosphoribosyltransferase family protein [Kordia aestuariivivens]MBC8757640.1 phosphoribosyltransferase [Kordia aestuariivivens]